MLTMVTLPRKGQNDHQLTIYKQRIADILAHQQIIIERNMAGLQNNNIETFNDTTASYTTM